MYREKEAGSIPYGIVPGRILEIGQEYSTEDKDWEAQYRKCRKQRQCQDCKQGAKENVSVVALRHFPVHKVLDPVAQQFEPFLGIHIADLIQQHRLSKADLDRLEKAEKVSICEADRHNVYLLASFLFGELSEAENALLDRTLDFSLRPVSAFYIKAERHLMVKAFHYLLEDLLVTAHGRHSVALARQRNNAQPSQRLVGLGLAEDISPGPKCSGVPAGVKQEQRVHHCTAVIGGEDDRSVIREQVPALYFNCTVAMFDTNM